MSKPKLIQLIHIASSELKLDKDTYSQMLLTLTGKTSTRDMDVPQLTKVLKSLKGKGFKVRPAKKARAQHPLDDSPQSKKIRALWLEMADQGIVRDSSEQALARWIKRETGVDSLQWLEPEQASSAIEKLKQWQHRAVRKPS
ncbi:MULTISPECIES: gp16 family protein [unclassified Serratia (in: enterobacteria)]|uniref:gp16 family protein n=1 Tax=unclassified Serratia (in: enterobacteria) TaxID=2647522 RepID=UPI000A955307|nr:MULTISPECIES: regulatory protein GemA [unclassified Serratia (in: enterobacteria)]